MTARPSLRANVVANYAAKAVMASLGLVFPPIYARLLGIESWALMGFYGMLTMVLGLLDLGLGTTLNRELAKLTATPSEENEAEMRDLVASFERVYWTIGCCAAIAVALAAPLLARHWFNDAKLPASTITNAVRLMGIVFALQWPCGVYDGAMLGMQRQVTLNAIQVSFGLARILGAAVVVVFVSRTIEAFFIWQVIVYGSQAWVSRRTLERCLPASRFGGYDKRLLVKNWRFSTGMMAASMLSVALVQLDKIIVSKTLTMQEFGYYTLAGTAGNSLYYLIGPLFAAIFPRFSQLVAQGDDLGLARIYHRSAQLMAVLLLPSAIVLALFAPNLMLAWTGSQETADHTWRVATFLALGTALNGLMNVPYAAQIAYGWTRLTVIMNSIAIVVLAPTLFFLARSYGAPGAAIGWFALNAGYVAIGVRFFHRRYLKRELGRWYLHDTLIPAVGALLGALPIRLLVRVPLGRWQMVAVAGFSIVLSTIVAGLATESTRTEALAFIARLRAKSSGA